MRRLATALAVGMLVIAAACAGRAGPAGDEAPTSSAPPPASHTIVIKAMTYEPARLEVRAGDTVIWKNEDLVPHTATADGAFDSGEIESDASFRLVARTPGEVPYVCTMHPGMAGLLVVR